MQVNKTPRHSDNLSRMADKKNSSLAKQLIDDLLEEDLVLSEVEITKPPEPQNSQTEIPPYPSGVSLSVPGKTDAFAVSRLEEEDKTIPLGQAPEDKTMQISESTRGAHSPIDDTLKKRENRPNAEVADQVRAGVGRFAPLRTGAMTSADASLAQAENLRIAQSRILELEAEIERLRSDNEQLAAAGETLRQIADENLAQVEAVRNRYSNLEAANEDERHLLQTGMQAKEKELEVLRTKVGEMEMRLSSNIQKIRVRERELENRLELVRMESQALLRSKDEMILDLKRKNDHLNLELDNFRNKGQELNRQIQDKQELLRRTVKALRLALSMLEGSEDPALQKKAK